MDFKKLFRPGILASRPYTPGKPVEEVQRELGLEKVIKLASNENPEGPLPAVVEAVRTAALGINRYPDAGCFKLTQKLAAHLDVSPKSLIFGNGSNEVIDILIRALVSPGENVVFSEHSFLVYPLTCGVHFQCGNAVPLGEGDKHDLKAMAAAVNAKTKLVLVCNPNNPTGTHNTTEEFVNFMESVPENVIVGVDEAYYEYATAEDYPQTLGMMKQYPNLVLLRTFSKIHSLAGLRVGYGVGHPDLISELHKTREPFNVNMLSQAAAIACLEHWDEVPGRCERNRLERERMASELTAMGLDVVPSETNFILIRIPGHAGEMTENLLKRGIIVRPMHAFGLGDGALRISIGLPDENNQCLANIKELLA